MKRLYFTINKKLLPVLFLLCVACNGVFVPDPIDPRVPKYTESGNNAVGALINNKVWKSTTTYNIIYTSNLPEINYYTGVDSLSIQFTGYTGELPASIEFHLKDLNIKKYDDLVELNDRKILIDGDKDAAYYIENHNLNGNRKGKGQIYFRQVKRDDASSAILFSGTFSFTTTNWDGTEIKVTSGRFDYRLFNDIYYAY